MRFLVFFFSLFVVFGTQANNSVLDDLLAPAQQQTFLPVNEAFKLDFDQQGSTLFVGWDIAPGYYLYKKNLQIIAKQADIEVPELEQGKMIEDEFFGRTEVYFNNLSIISKLSNIQQGAYVKVRYQGCAEAGLCYPPEIVEIPLSVIASKAMSNNDDSDDIDVESDEQVDNEDLSFTEQLLQRSLLANILTFFGLGIGLAFTPCVFPMFPILSSLIAGQQGLSTRKAFSLSFVYVQGMAVTYALLGLVVAYFGGQVQGYLQHPTVLISFSLLFVILAASMFGWYEIKLPSGMMDKLTQMSNKQQGGNYLGVFSMGVLSGLIASPCTTAPLSGALLFVAQTGDFVIGGVTLYALSLGMGLPLLLLGTSGGKLLPKAGGWMEQVKTLFGFVMLFVPLILLERILPFEVILLLAGLLSMATAVYLHFWQTTLNAGKAKSIMWAFAMLFFIGGFTLTKNYLFPSESATTQQRVSTPTGQFVKLADLAALNDFLEKTDKPVVVDLYADWCVACKEFENYTFPDPKVQDEFKNFNLIKLDLTESNEKTMEIMQNFDVFGLPTMLIFNSDGKELKKLRITGFMGAGEFAEHLRKVKK
ncbi:protein-disulfide reductase DsbD [Pseudoalteromonas sp. T1lg65]|uniref:protein-disulfide reductase DsbD n=1 Tax=Pseudoalteromonas sp. T1lg65 TaxID=2077101 RepID=UPI003F7B1EA3